MPDRPDRPDALHRCAVCHAPAAGRYCGACGARRPLPEDESLGRFLREQFQEVTSADGKLWRTVRALARPGALTAAYFDGRRDLYVRPVRLFLVLNVVLFFALGFFGQNPLIGALETQRGSLGVWTSGAVGRALEAWGGDAAVFEALFDQRAFTLASTLVGLFVPAFAGVFRLVLAAARNCRSSADENVRVAVLFGPDVAARRRPRSVRSPNLDAPPSRRARDRTRSPYAAQTLPRGRPLKGRHRSTARH